MIIDFSMVTSQKSIYKRIIHRTSCRTQVIGICSMIRLTDSVFFHADRKAVETNQDRHIIWLRRLSFRQVICPSICHVRQFWNASADIKVKAYSIGWGSVTLPAYATFTPKNFEGRMPPRNDLLLCNLYSNVTDSSIGTRHDWQFTSSWWWLYVSNNDVWFLLQFCADANAALQSAHNFLVAYSLRRLAYWRQRKSRVQQQSPFVDVFMSSRLTTAATVPPCRSD